MKQFFKHLTSFHPSVREDEDGFIDSVHFLGDLGYNLFWQKEHIGDMALDLDLQSILSGVHLITFQYSRSFALHSQLSNVCGRVKASASEDAANHNH